MRVLILGGTADANRLAERLSDAGGFEVVLSLAGRTKDPGHAAVPTRIGGFGGAQGLAAWLRAHGIDGLIDATHPFASRMRNNAAQAADRAGIPLARLERPAWAPQPGDDWVGVADRAEAARAVEAVDPTGSVLLTIGRRELEPFAALRQYHWVVRTIEPPAPDPGFDSVTYVHERGPFDRHAERALMKRHDVGLLVTKASGGAHTRAKLDAARDHGVTVVMIQRPAEPASMGHTLHSLDDALAWLDGHASPAPSDATERGV